MIARHNAGRNAPANSSTPIYIGRTVIGNVDGDTFHKTISGSKHLLRRPRAICFDRCTLLDAAAAGAARAEIFDRETGTTYAATFETIDAHSFPVRRGHGDQVGVTLDHWSVNGATPAVKQRAAQSNQERKELQMGLFGEVTL